jgi:hypothetical protein
MCYRVKRGFRHWPAWQLPVGRTIGRLPK